MIQLTPNRWYLDKVTQLYSWQVCGTATNLIHFLSHYKCQWLKCSGYWPEWASERGKERGQSQVNVQPSFFLTIGARIGVLLGIIESPGIPNPKKASRVQLVPHLQHFHYRGSHYIPQFYNCMHKRGIFPLVVPHNIFFQSPKICVRQGPSVITKMTRLEWTHRAMSKAEHIVSVVCIVYTGGYKHECILNVVDNSSVHTWNWKWGSLCLCLLQGITTMNFSSMNSPPLNVSTMNYRVE